MRSRSVEVLDRHGASFATDLARLAAIEPSRVRRALRRIDESGAGDERPVRPAPRGIARDAPLAFRGSQRHVGRASRSARGRGGRYRLDPRAVGRVFMAGRRRGIRAARVGHGLARALWGLSREVVALEPSAPSWGELAPFLSRSEWRGELRRGYFVEGLSGVQYASADAAMELARLASAAADAAPLVLLCTTDPANLYGAGAPLDIELLEGGVARLPRLARQFPGPSGRPPGPDHRVVRKTIDRALVGPQADIDSALNLLPALTGPDRRILKVETYNGSRPRTAGRPRVWPNWASFAIIPAWLITPAGPRIPRDRMLET